MAPPYCGGYLNGAQPVPLISGGVYPATRLAATLRGALEA